MTMQTLGICLACIAASAAYWLAAVVVLIRGVALGARREWLALEARLEARTEMIDALCGEIASAFGHDPALVQLAGSLAMPPPPSEPDVRRMRRSIADGETVRKILAQLEIYPALFHSSRLVEVTEALLELSRVIDSNVERYNVYARSFNSRRHDFAAGVVTRVWSANDLPTLG